MPNQRLYITPHDPKRHETAHRTMSGPFATEAIAEAQAAIYAVTEDRPYDVIFVSHNTTLERVTPQ